MNDPRKADAPATAPPAFTPVPVRARRDGWTPDRQRAFIAALAKSASVDAAARAAGMRRETAYRLRARADAASFAAAWNAAMARHPRGFSAPALLWRRAMHGVRLHYVFEDGSVGTLYRHDNAAALKLLRRFDRLAGSSGKSQ